MKISEKIAFWYENIKRFLPWRNTSDPYKIWISEIILQQTRVNQGLNYYERFISTYPDIFTLAEADIDSVLKLWQGLGYYTRAHKLHETSKYIVTELKGKFPHEYNELLELKGIGPYTAAAISSIAFNQPVAAVDGNVKRVISRLFLIENALNSSKGKKIVNDLATQVLDLVNPGRHNQAMMELGATICLPKNPKCLDCPLNTFCLAFKDNRIQELPVKNEYKKVRKRFFIYIIFLTNDNKTCILKRKEKDIWRHLFEFPLIEVPGNRNPEEIRGLILKKYNIKPSDLVITKTSNEILHKLSHQHLFTFFIHARLKNKNIFSIEDGLWISSNDFSQFAVPRLIDRYIQREGF